MSMPNKWGHLVKPLELRRGPAGLYQQSRVWADGNEWQGYDGNFSFGYLTEPQVCHPIVGAVAHPYDEVLVFAGTDLADVCSLGGEMSIELGAEREEHVFDEPTAICVPAGLPHGCVRVRRIGFKPIAHYHFGLAPEYRAEVIAESDRPFRKTTGNTYAHLLKPLRTHASSVARSAMPGLTPDAGYEKRAEKAARLSKTGLSYDARADATGVLRPRDVVGPGNADQSVWLFGQDLEGFAVNFTWAFHTGTGKWHRGGEGHAHPHAQVLLWLGLDAYKPGYLGAEIEVGLGPDDERHVFTKPTAVVCPEGFVHLPVITRYADDAFAFIAGGLGAKYEAPWTPDQNQLHQS